MALLRLAAGGPIQCAVCGITDPEVLEIDHVYDDGARERRRFKKDGVVRRIARGECDPSRYQILCRNDNWKKHLQAERDRRMGIVGFDITALSVVD